MENHGILPELDGASETRPVSYNPDNQVIRVTTADDLTDRQVIERIFTQLAYLVDTLAPHGQVMRNLDIVAASFVAGGPLWGRLDHQDVQDHELVRKMDQVLAEVAPVRKFIEDNEDMMAKAKAMMAPGEAIRAAMPGGHRRRRQ